MTYNGWTNYETWVVNLWIYNSEGDSEYWESEAAEILEQLRDDAVESISSRDHAVAIDELADRLSDSHQESLEMLFGGCCTGALFDMLQADLSGVNWREIASHLVDAALDTLRNA